MSDASFCKRGHAFSEANTYVRRDGTRACRACRAERMRAYRSGGPSEVVKRIVQQALRGAAEINACDSQRFALALLRRAMYRVKTRCA